MNIIYQLPFEIVVFAKHKQWRSSLDHNAK